MDTECYQDVYTGKVSIELGKYRVRLGYISTDLCAEDVRDMHGVHGDAEGGQT